jgi:hypothetical protein
MQPPVVIPSPNSVSNRPQPRQRSHSRHGSVSSASERPEILNGFDPSLSDDQNGVDAESHRSTLRPPPKSYSVSNQNLVPPSPRGSRKPTEPRNGSPARSNPRSHSPFLSTDRSGPHSPDLRRGRPNYFTTLSQPRAVPASPERSRPVCDDRSFSGVSGTSPHSRSGSEVLTERERLEVYGDVPRIDERTPVKRKCASGKNEFEASKLTREPSWVMVDGVQEGTRLPRVGRGPKSSPRYQPSNSSLSRPHGILIPRQQPASSPGGDRESRSSVRQAVPLGWADKSKPPSGDPSSPVPLYNLKMAKSMDNLRDRTTLALLTPGRPRPVPPPLPATPSLGNLSQSKDGTLTHHLVDGDAVGSSSQREVNLPPPNDPLKRQVEPPRPLLRTSPTNSRPVRPLPQQTPGQPLPEVAVTTTPLPPRLPFPQSPPTGLSTSTSSMPGLQPTQPDPISRPRSVLDEESISPAQHLPRLQRPVDSSVFSEPLQESDILRSPLPQAPRFVPPRQLPPLISREDSAPLTTTRALPIPGRAPATAMDDRSPDVRPGSLNDNKSTPANRTPPRSPISPRSPWIDSRERFAVASAATNADAPRNHGQSRDLIDFNKPAEKTITQDDKTLRAIQHILDSQISSDEATMVPKPKSTYVLPPIPPPPPPPLQTMRNIGYVPPPPPLPKPPAPAPIPVTQTSSNSSIYTPSTPETPISQPSDQDGSDSEAGTLWQKPMIEEEPLTDRPKSASRGPPLTVKIGEQFGGSPVQAPQLKSSSSSGGGLTLIPINFPPPPKHPPPSPPLPHWGSRTPTARQSNKKQSKVDNSVQDSSWASRPNPEEVINKLEVWFPDHDLDKPVIEASSGGTSPTVAENPPAPLPYNGKSDKRSRHKKSIRVVAEEHNLRQDRTSRLQSSSASNVFRKRSTKLWDSRVEEVTPGQITSGMPPIPDSPSASGSGASAPKRPFLFMILRTRITVAHIYAS